ncbi:carbonic anhydrase-related protein 10-like protein [Leptotrombidium deliense]|uniref:Carbonic anhydrase-related protein 10-like protein n=1 Tax=Leptotrombidium deliense TaxID=299467 RepID=A0A443SVZ0_9ACAR|nr:carbonic anhydrase-related protein 10-like protein [Leptotrombidium deliense]
MLIIQLKKNEKILVTKRPDFWGLLNPEWSLCNKGRRQSPIDIKPQLLLYDPFLRPVHMDKHKVNGKLENNGHSVVFRITETERSNEGSTVTNQNQNISARQTTRMQIDGGPLSYSYRFESIHLHFGRSDTSGSEHTLNGVSFPAEVRRSCTDMCLSVYREEQSDIYLLLNTIDDN